MRLPVEFVGLGEKGEALLLIEQQLDPDARKVAPNLRLIADQQFPAAAVVVVNYALQQAHQEGGIGWQVMIFGLWQGGLSNQGWSKKVIRVIIRASGFSRSQYLAIPISSSKVHEIGGRGKGTAYGKTLRRNIT